MKKQSVVFVFTLLAVPHIHRMDFPLQQTSLVQVCFTTSRISLIRQQYKNGFKEELIKTMVEVRELLRNKWTG